MTSAKSVEIHVVDAFTRQAGYGNRAGVVLEAGSISDAEMQSIAAFAGFSETAFVLPASSDDHDVHVRYFTPIAEVPVCGHATIATHYLRARKLGLSSRVVQAKTGVGVLPVNISGEGADTRIDMTQGKPEFGAILTDALRTDLIASLGMRATDLSTDLPIQIVSTGHSKVMVPVESLAVVNKLSPDMSRLAELSQRLSCNGFFPFAVDETTSGLRTHGRMFAPAIGIDEDPVTGNANGPAGAYLVHYKRIQLQDEFSYEGHQGQAMEKPGIVFVTLKKSDDSVATVQVGGYAVESASLFYPGGAT